MLQLFINNFIIVYFNDIFIYSDTKKNHIKNVLQILIVLLTADLFIKLSKYM